MNVILDELAACGIQPPVEFEVGSTTDTLLVILHHRRRLASRSGLPVIGVLVVAHTGVLKKAHELTKPGSGLELGAAEVVINLDPVNKTKRTRGVEREVSLCVTGGPSIRYLELQVRVLCQIRTLQPGKVYLDSVLWVIVREGRLLLEHVRTRLWHRGRSRETQLLRENNIGLVGHDTSVVNINYEGNNIFRLDSDGWLPTGCVDHLERHEQVIGVC